MALGLCRFTNALGGTSDFIYPGPSIDMQSPASAGAVNGTTYKYYAQSLDMNDWEIGTGAYTAGTQTFARTAVQSNSLGTTAKISFSNPPQVIIFDLYTPFDPSSYAPLASPVFTGNPTAPTPTFGDNDTSIATTAFVQAAVSPVAADVVKARSNQFARVALSATQSGVPDSVYTKVSFNSVTYDPSGIWDAVNKQFKPTVAGLYRLSWLVYLRNNAGGSQLSRMVASSQSFGSYQSAAAVESMSSGSDMIAFNGSSDTAELQGFISSGTARIFDTTSHFEIELVRAT